jgi:putative ABC transport system permease protein
MFVAISRLWRNLFDKQTTERELDDEIRSYVDMLTTEKIAAGTIPEVARRQALLAAGGIEQVKEQVREARRGHAIEGIAADLRQALRTLGNNPGFAILATLMLALGIGATTLVFSVFYSVLLRPLPFKEPGRLVQVWEARPQKGWQQASFTEANFWDVRAMSKAFEDVGAFTLADMTITGSGAPQHLTVGRVSAQFFYVLGVRPSLGRLFFPHEDQPGHDNHTVLLEHNFWVSRFGASPAILGKMLRLDGQSYRVAGVLPAGEPWLNDADAFIPLVYSPAASRGSFEFSVIARLKKGVSLEGAKSDLAAVCGRLAELYPANDTGMAIKIEPASAWGADAKLRSALWVLLGAVGFLLLIACVNLANLLLARATARTREITIRSALGANRARIIRLVLGEAFVVSFIGAGLGLLLARQGLDLIRAGNLNGIPHISSIGLNGWVLGFTLIITILVVICSGLIPALQAPRRDLAAALREGDRSQAGNRSQYRLRSALVTAEVALSLMLLIGAGLLIRSFDKLLHVDRGFQTSHRIIATVNMPGSYNGSRIDQTVRAYNSHVSSLPGVQAVAAASSRPVLGWDSGMGIVAADHPDPANGNVPWASWRFITSDYFRAMGIPILQGRAFAERDRKGAPWRIVISQKLAELFWPGQNPIGRKAILWKGQGNEVAEVIGVVGDIRDHGLDSDPTRIVYIPYYGTGWPVAQFIVRAAENPANLVPLLRSSLTEIDPSLPLSDVRTLQDIVDASVGTKRLNTILITTFAGIALILAMTGIYGVLSYSVAKRTAEIGVRIALGANPKRIFILIAGQGMRPILMGIVIGLAGAAALSSLLGSLLFEVKPLDTTTYVAVSLLIVLVALLACYVPIRRALRVDPAAALREE